MTKKGSHLLNSILNLELEWSKIPKGLFKIGICNLCIYKSFFQTQHLIQEFVLVIMHRKITFSLRIYWSFSRFDKGNYFFESYKVIKIQIDYMREAYLCLQCHRVAILNLFIDMILDILLTSELLSSCFYRINTLLIFWKVQSTQEKPCMSLLFSLACSSWKESTSETKDQEEQRLTANKISS